MHRQCLLLLLVLLCDISAFAQDEVPRKKTEGRISLLVYARVISNSRGAFRFDENVVSNFRLNTLLRLEAGLRYGQRSQHFNSYYHYKLELQSRYFWNTVRLIARMSDNVIEYPSPAYRKTNGVLAVEGKFRLSPRWQLMTAAGYVWSAQQDNHHEPLPTRQGVHNNYPVFKAAMRYVLAKGFLETTYGSYDTFNPYEPDKPFLQEAFEYELSDRFTTYNYFRYEYDRDLLTPLNYFLSFGLRARLAP